MRISVVLSGTRPQRDHRAHATNSAQGAATKGDAKLVHAAVTTAAAVTIGTVTRSQVLISVKRLVIHPRPPHTQAVGTATARTKGSLSALHHGRP